MDIIVITDFDNFFPKPMSEYSAAVLETFFLDVINVCLNDNVNVTGITIRLYGGWYQGNAYSQKASQLQVTLQSMSIFPVIKKGQYIGGCISLAEQQYGVTQTWYNTFQEKRGIQKVTVDWTHIGTGCSQTSPNCPVKVLQNFIKNKSHQCPHAGCGTIQSEVFIRREQKMVDTMMACDIITYCAEENIAAIYAISDDTDLFPAIAISKIKNPTKSITVLMKNTQKYNQYQSVLSQFGANVKLLLL